MFIKFRILLSLALVTLGYSGIKAQYFDEIYAKKETPKKQSKSKLDSQSILQLTDSIEQEIEQEKVRTYIEKENGEVEVVFYSVKEEPIKVELPTQNLPDAPQELSENKAIHPNAKRPVQQNFSTPPPTGVVFPRVIYVDRPVYRNPHRNQQKVRYSAPRKAKRINRNYNTRSSSYTQQPVFKNRQVRKVIRSTRNQNSRTSSTKNSRTNGRTSNSRSSR